MKISNGLPSMQPHTRAGERRADARRRIVDREGRRVGEAGRLARDGVDVVRLDVRPVGAQPRSTAGEVSLHQRDECVVAVRCRCELDARVADVVTLLVQLVEDATDDRAQLLG